MSESPARDYRSSVFLPKTDFPMKAGLAATEPAWLARWAAEDVYGTLRAQRAGREKFILHDGPPYANGDIHIGHALNHILKDLVVRTQSMLGKDAPYVPGWDCHGLPIEWKVEEQYRAAKRSKDAVPPAEFRAECRAYAQHWVDRQREQLIRLGVGGDWDHPYLTMDFASEATIVAELLKFAASGQLYRGAKPVMWSPVEKTALAEAEVEYADITSTQIDVAFEITHAPNAPELVGAYAVIWTTTPWTIPVNQAIAYGAGVEYVRLQMSSTGVFGWGDQSAVSDRNPGHRYFRKQFVVAADLIEPFKERISADLSREASLIQGGSTVEINFYEHSRFKGSDLAGAIARHPMANHLRRPALDAGLGSPSDGGEASLAPDQVRGDGVDERGREAGGDRTAALFARPRPFLAGAIARHPMANHLRRPALDAGLGFLSTGDEGSQAPDQVRGDGAEERGREASWDRTAAFFARPRPFLAGDFVTTEQGTGLVHMAPDHGEDDFDLCKANGIDPVFAVEGDGRYRDDWAWPADKSLSVINAKLNDPSGPICSDLREVGALLSARNDESTRHSYPHSWRSHAKLIFRATPQWFIPMDAPLPPPSASPPPPPEGEDVARVSSDPPPPGEGDRASWRGGGGRTLREIALAAIAATRWVPPRGQNRITAMVAGRPDWVISRQRAWGVPITLFVDRRSGDYLRDVAVDARIVAAVKAGGADAWWATDPAVFLGPGRDAADYERVDDILDVWFDSGCTHAFVLESGRWPALVRSPGDAGPPADLYLEGSDQHRGWFQSSLLESCGTRGRAPYRAVMTHGMTLDAKGFKQSKSLGNVTDPAKVMATYGADIVRLWTATVDATEDHRIGDEVLKGVADQYRKLRNTFRYLLGALDGWDEAERVTDPSDMPELERWVLHRVAEIDAGLRAAVADFDFNACVTLVSTFVNNDLSAFYFDVRKDSLYCDAAATMKRRACRTVLATLFDALAKWLAPVLVFTAEEAWRTRYPDAASVHLEAWDDYSKLQPASDRADLHGRWMGVRYFRADINAALEGMRRDKVIGSSLEAGITVYRVGGMAKRFAAVDWAEVLLVAKVDWVDGAAPNDAQLFLHALDNTPTPTMGFKVWRSHDPRCDRCRRHLPDVAPATGLCGRCTEVVG